MPESSLDIQKYYNEFEHNSIDLSLMREVLGKIELPPNALKSIEEKESAQFLVLGSATPRNLDNIALIDKALRPGKGNQDKVTIVDANIYPLERHNERIKFLDEWHASYKQNNPDQPNPLQYPKFNLAQGDIRQLPFEKRSVDVVLSDYTFNFLSTIEDVDKAFAEIARVLSDEGVVLISIKGNEKYKADQLVDEQQMTDLQPYQFDGGTIVNLFPLQTYISIAQRYGLELIGKNTSGSDLLCGVLKKKTVSGTGMASTTR